MRVLSVITNAGFAALVATVVVACGGGDGSGDGADAGGTGPDGQAPEGLSAISLEPENPTLVVEDGERASQAFSAIGEFDDGTTEDLTGEVQFSVSTSALGSFSGSTLETRSQQGGKGQATARIGGVQGSTDVTVRFVASYDDPESDLPDDPGRVFDGAAEDDDLAPQVVYPAPGVLVPPNLEDLEVHFIPPDDGELFELSFQSETTDVTVYTDCALEVGDGCIYAPQQEVWRGVAGSNRDGSVTLGVRATDGDGEAAGAAEPQDIAFTDDDIQGAIYYWTTSVGGSDRTTAIVRFDFAGNQDAPEPFITEDQIPSDQVNNSCVGCHALSPEGERMFTAVDGGLDGRTLLTDVRTGEPLVEFDSTPNNAFASWSPDGEQFVGVFGNDSYSCDDENGNGDENGNDEDCGFIGYDLNVFDGATGEHTGTIDVGGDEDNPSHHPDWAPSGNQMVFGRVLGAPRSNGSLATARQAAIGLIEREDEDADWSEPVFLTDPDEGENTFFPTFSPESDLIAYNRSSCDSGSNDDECNAHDDENATLFVIQPDEDAEPVRLDRANEPGILDAERDEIMNSFPKWTPFTFERTGEFGSRIYWMSFSSDRSYGLRDTSTLLWMTAVDPGAAIAGQDPSTPAFAIPFQALESENHTAQWTETSVIIE